MRQFITLHITRRWWYFGTDEGEGGRGADARVFKVSRSRPNILLHDYDVAICDTMRINDDGSLTIPNVNRRKHRGTWRCEAATNASSASEDAQDAENRVLDIKLQIDQAG